jgi:F-type H+-transporting ATPase subunit gamma
MALKDIKAKIAATKRMNTVTRAMEAVSAVKMRKTQATAFAGRPYTRAALSVLARVSGTFDSLRHPLMQVRTSDVLTSRIAVVVMTSDKGLAGGLNSGVLKAVHAVVAPYTKDAVTVFAYGKKGEEFFARRGYEITKAYENRRDDVDISVMEDLGRELSEGFRIGLYDQVIAVYSNFKSTFEQAPTVRTLLPLSTEGVSELIKDIKPQKGAWSAQVSTEAPTGYTVESNTGDILSVLVPRLVAVSLYHMLLEAKASEHSARMVAMKNASDKSKEVTRDLTRTYNKVRQAAITREVSEIVGGREALAT